ncbi:MAG: hypothetical protein IKO06_00120 [Alphaproteobacteria bacterium]|nr:hypothetical protein [Alphaproteobacteria bacterium]
MKKIFTSPFFTPVMFTLLWGTLVSVVLLYFPEQKFAVTEDGQIIDIITNIGYILMIAVMLLLAKDYADKPTSWGIYLFLGIAAFLREGGIQHHLSKTDTTPFKSRFFLNPANPVGEKIIFGLILVVIFGALAYLAVKYTKHLIVSFFKLNPITWSTAVFCTVLVCAKFADRFPSNWRKAHDDTLLPREQIEVWSLLEESLEMFLPYIIIIMLLQYHVMRQKPEASLKKPTKKAKKK